MPPVIFRQGSGRVVSSVLRFATGTLTQAAGEAVYTPPGGGGGGGAWTSSGYTGTANRFAVFNSSGSAAYLDLPSTGLVAWTGSAWASTTIDSPLSLAAGHLSVDLSAYLTTAAAAATYQPLDADLTALAGLGDGLPYRSGGVWGATALGDLSISGGSVQVTQARGLRESGGTTLTMGAVSAGQLLGRSGTSIVGLSASASPTANYIVIADASGKVDYWVSDGTTSTKGKLQLATNGESNGAKACASNDTRLSAGTYPYPDPIVYSYGRWTPASSAVNSDGVVASTFGTVAASITDTAPPSLKFSTASVATQCGVAALTVARLGHNSRMQILITTDSTTTNRRYRIGFYTASPGAADTPGSGGYYLLFRYSTDASDTTWKIVHGISTGYTVTDTGLTYNANKQYVYTLTTSSSGITYQISDGTTSYSTTITSNNPAASADLHWACVMNTTTAVSRSFFFRACTISTLQPT